MYVKQPFHKLYRQITWEFLGLRMQNFWGIICISNCMVLGAINDKFDKL